jgi:hypothetical protein
LLNVSACDVPPVRLGLDPVAALDSFRRLTAYVALALVSVALSASPALTRRVVGSIAVSGLLLLALGLIAPASNSEVLWHFELPTHGRDWSSFAVNPLLSSMFAYARPFEFAGIPLVLDELQVSRHVVGPVLNPNQYAAVVGATVPLMLAGLGSWLERRKMPLSSVMLAGLGLGLCALVYWMTGSRGGAAALVVAIVVFLSMRSQSLTPRLVLLASGAFVIVVSLCLPLALWAFGLEPNDGRLVIWRQAVHSFLDHPWLGHGLATFQDLRLDTSARLFTPWLSAHNVPLQVLVEIGILGVTVCLAIAASLLRGHHPTLNPDPIDAGLVASLVFSMAHASVDYSPAMPFSAAITAVVAGLLLGRRLSCTGRPPRPKAGLGMALTAVPLLVLTPVLIASSVLYAEAASREGRIRHLTAQLVSGTASEGVAVRFPRREIEV